MFSDYYSQGSGVIGWVRHELLTIPKETGYGLRYPAVKERVVLAGIFGKAVQTIFDKLRDVSRMRWRTVNKASC